MTTLADKELVALFIDAENTKPDFEQLFTFCRSYGEIRIARIYGYRELLRLPRWQKEYKQFQLDPVYAEKGRKNSADMLLALDSVESLYLYPDINTYVIASMDYDFLPLAHRLRKHKKKTIGVSTRYPPAMMRSSFHEYHTLLRPEWDVFEFCAQQFYLAYLDRQADNGWALADEVFFSLSEPVPFLRRLHQMGFDSFFSFLKNCRFFLVQKEKVQTPRGQIIAYWIRNPFDANTAPMDRTNRSWFQKYAQEYFIRNSYYISAGIPSLIQYFKKKELIQAVSVDHATNLFHK